jgi:hypothetical protein
LHDLLGACRAGDHATDNRISGKPGDSQLRQLDPAPVGDSLQAVDN